MASRPVFFPHLNAHRKNRWVLTEDESNRSYYRMAQSLVRQPHVKGLVASSWLHSSDTFVVSPHLAWMNRTFLENGGLVVRDGPCRSRLRGAVAQSGAKAALRRGAVQADDRLGDLAAARDDRLGPTPSGVRGIRNRRSLSMPRVTPAEIVVALAPLGTATGSSAAAAFVPRLDRDFTADAAEALLSAHPPGPGGRSCGDDPSNSTALASSPAAPLPAGASVASCVGRRRSRGGTLVGASRIRCVPRSIRHPAGRARRSRSCRGGMPAALWIRIALRQHPPYAWFARAERLLDAVLANAAKPARRVRIGIAGSSTTSFMVPLLRALCFREGIDGGGVRRTVRCVPSGNSRSRLPAWPAFVPTSSSSPRTGAISICLQSSRTKRGRSEQLADDFGVCGRPPPRASGVMSYSTRSICPPSDSYGILAQRLAGSRRRVIDRLNLQLEAHAPSFASILDTSRVVARVGVDAWADPRQWQLSHQHPARDRAAGPRRGADRARQSRYRSQPKGRRLRFDNTLWGGIVGEDGVDGIHVGDTPGGAGHRELQQYLRELKERGVLLAVCSKNNPDDARLPFESHPGMVLRLEDFAAFWRTGTTRSRTSGGLPKCCGLDSTASWCSTTIRSSDRGFASELPEVAVVELGPTAASYTADLDRGRYFEVLASSTEDRRRTEHYQRERAVDAARASAGSLDAFLEGLAMRGTCAPMTAARTSIASCSSRTRPISST